MKKGLLVLCGVIMIFITAAQSGISINAGISIPVMCYASRNPGNPDAGIARPGFYFDIGYTYRLSAFSGVRTLLYYTSNAAGNNRVTSSGAYRLAGWMAGPTLSSRDGRKWQGSFSPLAGYSRVWTPQLQRNNQTWLFKQATGCFSWGGELMLRYQLNDNSYLRFGAGHLNMKPRLDAFNNGTAKQEQHIVLVNGIAGFGWQW